MRYQNKLFVIIILFSVLVSMGIIKIINNSWKKTMAHYKIKRITEYDIVYDIPMFHNPQFYPKGYDNNGWFTEKYVWNKIGIFRVSVANGNNSDFKKLSVKYFGLGSFPISGKKFYFPQKNLYFKNIPLFENGAYVVKKTGKIISYIYFFTINNKLYWFDFYTRSTLENYKKIFDKILLSINSKNGKLKKKLSEEKFKKEINSICPESYFLLCQSIRATILLPLFLMIIIFFIISKIMSLGGKLPDESFFSNDFPLFKEEKVEYQLKFQLNNKISTGALIITAKNLYLFSFKKPLFILPKETQDYNLKTGKSFLGGEYILIESSNYDYFKKRNRFPILGRRGKYTIKIYSRNIETVKRYIKVENNRGLL